MTSKEKFPKLTRNHKSLKIKVREWNKKTGSRGPNHNSELRISKFKPARVS